MLYTFHILGSTLKVVGRVSFSSVSIPNFTGTAYEKIRPFNQKQLIA